MAFSCAALTWLAVLHPGAADQLLFLQLALLTFFLGAVPGAFCLLPTWLGYTSLVSNPWDRLFFAGLCLYGWLIAGVTTWKYRQSRSHELQMKSSLELARQVQLSLQPPTEVRGSGWEMASRIDAYRELGGDLVCWQGRFVLVGDVMGKGAQAALTAAYVKGLFDSLASQVSDPRQLLLGLHAHLARRTYVDSFFCGLCVEISQHEWKICRAGFPPAFLERADGTALTADCCGMMIGLPFEPELEVEAFERHPQDQWLIASDGLIEEEQATPELRQQLQKVSALPVGQALDALVAFLQGGPCAPDDRTAVLLR